MLAFDGGATRKKHKSEIMTISPSVKETKKIALPTLGGGTTRAARASVEKARRWRYPLQRDGKDDDTREGGRRRNEGGHASVARVI